MKGREMEKMFFLFLRRRCLLMLCAKTGLSYDTIPRARAYFEA